MLQYKNPSPSRNVRFFLGFSCLFFLLILYSKTRPSKQDYYVQVYLDGFDIVEEKWDLTSMGNPPHLKCSAFAAGDKEALQQYRNIGNVVFNEDPPLPMECDSIKYRIQLRGHAQKNANVPYAVARNVFLHYYMQETLLANNYSPGNSYCFAIDRKALPAFKKSMKQMERCLDNVKIIDEEFAFDSMGHFQDFAHIKCIQYLLTRPKWEYVLLLQNNDIILRTNNEISEILRVINGTQLSGTNKALVARYHSNKLFTAKNVKIFKDESSKSNTQLNTNTTVVMSLNQVFMSREFVAALNEEVDMDRVADEFNDPELLCVDEMLFSTLAYAHHLGLPGQTSNICYRQDYGLVRYQHWDFDKDVVKCRSPFKRHGICILTVEYLKEFNSFPQIIGNKVMASYDFGTVLCMSEILQKRAIEDKPFAALNRYSNLHQVHQLRLRKNGTFNATTYTCPQEEYY